MTLNKPIVYVRQPSTPYEVTVLEMLSQDPGIPDRKTGYPSAADPFTPDVSASSDGVTDDNRASIIFVQLPTLYISCFVCQQLYFKIAIFVLFSSINAKSEYIILMK